jgi:hypothetical protein
LTSDSRLTNGRSTRTGQSVLETSSMGCAARSRLDAGRGEGVVQGVFDGAINILMSGGLISLVPEAGERGPLNLSVRLPVGQERMSALGIRDGDKVVLAGSSLELGDHCRIDFGRAPVDSPSSKLLAPLLGKREIGENLEVVKRAALLHGNMAGLGGLLAMANTGAARPRPCDLNIFASAALPRISRLESALRAGEGSALTDAVRGLVGLGPGLTPSSDDMLAALVLVCVLYSEGERRAEPRRVPIAKAVDSLPHGMTTVLSEEFLRQAASGRGNERVSRLCSAMLTGSRELVERETKRVLGIGETSGTDAVLGMVLGALFCLGRKPGLASGGPE